MSDATYLLWRYRVAVVAVIAALSLAMWPGLLTPIAQTYTRFCARYLAHVPFFHHLPPYAITTILVGLAAMMLTAAYLVGRQLIGQRQLERRAAAYRCSDGLEHLAIISDIGLDRHVVVTQDRSAYAFCAGLISPRIYLSTGLLAILTQPEIEAVLRHEARHLKRGDPLRLFVADLVRVLLSPFPAISTLIDRIRINVELAADRSALEAVPVDVLASALVKVARPQLSPAPSFGVAGLTPTAARIDALLGRPVVVPFARVELVVTGLVALAMIGLIVHLAQVPLPMAPACPACAPF